MSDEASGVDPRLKQLIGSNVSADDNLVWAGISEAQRAKTIQRIKALNRYLDPESEISAKQAAADAGVELGRFYQLARAWRDERRLSVVGARAAAPASRQKLKPEDANILQASVKEIVASADPNESVNSLAKKLHAYSGLQSRLAMNTLRQFVEREQRRLKRAAAAGSELLFDFSASSIEDEQGKPVIVFFVFDRATHLIFGHACGARDASLRAYRLAAADAFQRIRTGPLQCAIWADQFERAQVIPGDDVNDIRSAVAGLASVAGGSAVQMTRQKKPGDYIREHIGPTIGTVRLFPGRISSEAATVIASPASRTALSEASAKIELAVLAYNADLLTSLSLSGETQPPVALGPLLEHFTNG